MGTSNRAAALERRIELLPGERERKMEDVEAAERLTAQLPIWQDGVCEIDGLLTACEDVIESCQPAWTRDYIKPARPFVYKIPVRSGNGSKAALDVLRVVDPARRSSTRAAVVNSPCGARR